MHTMNPRLREKRGGNTTMHEDRESVERGTLVSLFDRALESRDIHRVIPFFAADCCIELLRQKLTGREGVKKWLGWMYKNLSELSLVTDLVLIQENVVFQEFTLKAKLNAKGILESHQVRVIVFENGKIKNLRAYFDRMDFVEPLAQGFGAKSFVKQLMNLSIKGLA
jgi:hypothetical protein